MLDTPDIPIRLGCFAGSPVHYRVPLYRRIAATSGIDLEVIFASDRGVRPYDGGFGREIVWDDDLLEGYRWRFLRRSTLNDSANGLLAYRDLDVFSVVRAGDYDILWLNGYHTLTHALASLAQRSRRRPLLFLEEQTLLNKRHPFKTAVKKLALPLYFRGAGGLYISQNNLRWFEEYDFPSDSLFFMPYCVDNEKLVAQASLLRPAKDELVSTFGLPPDQPVVLTVCRLIEEKQVERLVDAFAMARARHRCSLLIVGSGPEEAHLRRRVDSLGLPNVTFAGFLNQREIARAYASADVFVLPSRNETFGLVVNEAMNFRLPIIVSDKVGCAPDLVHVGDNGFVFPWDRTDDLAACLIELVRSPELRERMGRHSEEAVAAWSYDSATAGLVQALEWAMSPRRGRHPGWQVSR